MTNETLILAAVQLAIARGATTQENIQECLQELSQMSIKEEAKEEVDIETLFK